MHIDPVLTHIDDRFLASLERLKSFLRIASISTDPLYADQCDAAADWLVNDLRSMGAMRVTKHKTSGHPLVTGHLPGDGPHILFYGHYDVQPVIPIHEWQRAPFDPRIEETNVGPVIRGRGASDDKGQLMTFVEACRGYLDVHGALPCSVSFLFEGEEEVGSPSLLPFLKDNTAMLRADIAAICDTAMIADKVPTIISQLRGILEEEFTLHGPDNDLHSGDYGGPALNPLKEVAHIIASFHNPDGSVAIEGFYDDVPELSDTYKTQWKSCGFDEMGFLKAVGLSKSQGEQGNTILEQIWARPTLELNGLWGGYQGPGSKTIIPAEAHCKLTCRLTGGMDPKRISRAIRHHVENLLPYDARVSGCTPNFLVMLRQFVALSTWRTLPTASFASMFLLPTAHSLRAPTTCSQTF